MFHSDYIDIWLVDCLHVLVLTSVIAYAQAFIAQPGHYPFYAASSDSAYKGWVLTRTYGWDDTAMEVCMVYLLLGS
jgi:hypothetical protein